ncbi:MAG: hypothetical protein JEY91_07150, partial [Spirochaetaceae bacterium]|nr:hypothetical protein [Spirochaetaceae bacterium]
MKEKYLTKRKRRIKVLSIYKKIIFILVFCIFSIIPKISAQCGSQSEISIDFQVPVPSSPFVYMHHIQLEITPTPNNIFSLSTHYNLQSPLGSTFSFTIGEEKFIETFEWYVLLSWDGSNVILDIYGDINIDPPSQSIYNNNTAPVSPENWTFTITDIDTTDMIGATYSITSRHFTAPSTWTTLSSPNAATITNDPDNPDPVVSLFTSSTATGTTSLDVNFTAAATSPNTAGPFDFIIDYGDSTDATF